MQEYRNDTIVVRYDPKVCTHSGRCVQGLAAVFDVGRKPWIDVNGAGAEADRGAGGPLSVRSPHHRKGGEGLGGYRPAAFAPIESDREFP